MKTTWVGIALVGIMVAVAGSAQADSLVLTQNSDCSYGNGGEFVAAWVPSLGVSLAHQGDNVNVFGGAFQTFCVEDNEYFYPGRTYSCVGTTYTTRGGTTGWDPWQNDANPSVQAARVRFVGTTVGTTPEDPICPETAYLYYQFWKGTLSGYDYTPGSARVASAGQLQQALWYLEGETTQNFGDLGSQAQTWINSAHSLWLSGGLGTWGHEKLWGVRVLNLTGTYPGYLDTPYAQDQLIVLDGVGDPASLLSVPVPAAAWLGLSSLGGLAVVRFLRRRWASQAA